MQNDHALDLTFRALGDRTRREMIRLLARGEPRTASELGAQFESSQPTISKHLKVLERARLIERTIEGREHRFTLRRKPLDDVGRWVARHQTLWSGAVDQLEQVLKERP